MLTQRRSALVPGCLSLVVASVSMSIPLSAHAAGTWNDRATTACVTAITPAFLASIFTRSAGAEAQKNPAGDGCTIGLGDNAFKFQIYDSESLADWNRINQKYHAGARAMTGVGDKAVVSGSDYMLSAWKDGNRVCSVVGLPFDPGNLKINGEALMKKLGEICNQLLALP